MRSAVIVPPLAQRAAVARRLGEEAGQRCLAKVEQDDADFGAKAYKFIVEYVRRQPCPVPGETVTLACINAGIVCHDHRAFGPLYAKAIRAGEIRVVGYCVRARGHSSMGGKLYASGDAGKARAGA